jgi:hypothetical protein
LTMTDVRAHFGLSARGAKGRKRKKTNAVRLNFC